MPEIIKKKNPPNDKSLAKGNFELKVLTKKELNKRRCRAYKLLIP
jgi:hypothetical protein